MKPAISKERFCEIMEKLVFFNRHLMLAEMEIADALELPCTDVFAKDRLDLLDSVTDVLQEAMGDDGIITDLIAEPPEKGDEFEMDVDLHCGKTAVIVFKGWGDLYDFFVLQAAQEGEGEAEGELRRRLCKEHGFVCC